MEKEESTKSYNCVLSKGFNKKGYFKTFSPGKKDQ